MLRVVFPAVALASLIGLAACSRDVAPTTPADAGMAGGASLEIAMDDENGGGRPHTEDIQQSLVTFTHLHFRDRVCEGEGGIYNETDHTFIGTVVGDPRLTGRIEVRLHDLFNFATESGAQTGRLVIRDASGRKKAEGDYGAWGPADMVQGTIVGRVYGQGSSNGRLHANWRIDYTVFPRFKAQIGGVVPDGRLPAGFWSGSCTGPWAESEIDLTSPAGLAAPSARRSSRASH